MSKFALLQISIAISAIFAWSGPAVAADIGVGRDSYSTQTGSFQPGAKPIVHPALPGSKILAVPALKPDSPAWVSITSQSGQPLSSVSVLVNGKPFEADNSGRVAFTVPTTAAVALSLQAEDGAEVAKINYELMPNGMLAWTGAAKIIQRLTAQSSSTTPQLTFAPAVVQPGQSAVVLGNGFDGRIQRDRVSIDGIHCEVTSASACAILASIPEHATIGPLRNLYVNTTGGDTLSVETDIAKAHIKLEHELRKGQEQAAQVQVEGTSLPVAVELTNASPDVVSIRTSDGDEVSDKAIVLMPGGSENCAPINAALKSKRRFHVTAKIIAETPELLAFDATARPDIFQTLEFNAIANMKRKLVAIESKIAESRAQSGGDSDKQLSQMQTLSLRRTALSSMLNARHLLLLAYGGTEQLYRQAIDAATGGALFVLESQVRNLGLIPERSVVSLRLQPQPTQPPPAVNLQRLAVPKFKLWPPADSSGNPLPMTQPGALVH